MFTGIVTALGTVRDITPLGGGADMRLVTIAAPWPDTGGDPDRRLDRLFRLLPHRGRGRRRLVRRGRLGRDAGAGPRSAAGRPARRSISSARCGSGDELGGHLVSGHVDGVGEVLSATPEHGSIRFVFRVPTRPGTLHRGRRAASRSTACR